MLRNAFGTGDRLSQGVGPGILSACSLRCQSLNGRPDQGCGYQWLVPEHKNGQTEIYCGSGGQFPVVVPEHNLVIVFQRVEHS